MSNERDPALCSLLSATLSALGLSALCHFTQKHANTLARSQQRTEIREQRAGSLSFDMYIGLF